MINILQKRKETKRNKPEWNRIKLKKSIFCRNGTERKEFKRNGKEQIDTEHYQYFVETERNENKRYGAERNIFDIL